MVEHLERVSRLAGGVRKAGCADLWASSSSTARHTEPVKRAEAARGDLERVLERRAILKRPAGGFGQHCEPARYRPGWGERGGYPPPVLVAKESVERGLTQEAVEEYTRR